VINLFRLHRNGRLWSVDACSYVFFSELLTVDKPFVVSMATKRDVTNKLIILAKAHKNLLKLDLFMAL